MRTYVPATTRASIWPVWRRNTNRVPFHWPIPCKYLCLPPFGWLRRLLCWNKFASIVRKIKHSTKYFLPVVKAHYFETFNFLRFCFVIVSIESGFRIFCSVGPYARARFDVQLAGVAGHVRNGRFPTWTFSTLDKYTNRTVFAPGIALFPSRIVINFRRSRRIRLLRRNRRRQMFDFVFVPAQICAAHVGRLGIVIGKHFLR